MAQSKIAESSPFKKDHIRNNMAYYFDDENIAIVEKDSGEWQSIKTTISPNTSVVDGNTVEHHRLNITYHSRYKSVAGLEDDINIDIGLKYGLHLALLDYLRARLHEDAGDIARSNYYYGKFRERIKKYPYRKSGVRGIQLFGLR
jgi:hypothetical protein